MIDFDDSISVSFVMHIIRDLLLICKNKSGNHFTFCGIRDDIFPELERYFGPHISFKTVSDMYYI